ncbi:YpdA family putative bacillithiol disulfide reductase [Scopulibacillus cellulosilyticus]|uniref:YpdA family putative bacillithiol disulfide reductase n=1 Tax=Scopulibacillus cellulosilyticus TaxID=2665665 RepID=A0ABW2PQ61_9BACL
MTREDVIVIGAGPCGLSAAIYLQEKGYQPLIIEKGNIVQAIYNYPTHQQFFSSSEKLEIGQMPFVIEGRKPKRNQALAYYREVVRRKKLRINAFETVTNVQKKDSGLFEITTFRDKYQEEAHYNARFVVIATGYYDHPNYMGVPGEDLPKVFHYFKEAHPFFDCDVVVVGGKNSAVDTTMELEKAGARITVIYRGKDYSPSVKPWILPEFQSLVKHNKIKMVFEGHIKEIKEDTVIYTTQDGQTHEIANDYVFAHTGYHPDQDFLKSIGIQIEEESGKPIYDPDTMETNVSGVFIAGVIAAGNNANEIFIENGRWHGEAIAKAIVEKDKEKTR